MKKINKITDRELFRELNDLFLEASRLGTASLVEYCLEKGADVHTYNNYALQWASRNGHKEVVEILKAYMNKSKN